MPIQTTAVIVTFTLSSSTANPPYEVAKCEGSITFTDNAPALLFSGWKARVIGSPQPNGAAFTLNVADSDYSKVNQTGVANWAVTFIPRGSTKAPSPFDNNQNTITGSGATVEKGIFTLNLGNAKIKVTGDWDWSLMIQMTLPGGAVKCFSSDPEMEVGT
jgi:hypothetical protein